MIDGPEEQSVHLCNSGASALTVFLEPWAVEFVLPTRGTLTLRCSGHEAADVLPEIESTDDLLTIWATGGSRIAVLIDGVDQDSFSGGYIAPDMGRLSPKAFVNLAFGDHPAARPGGRAAPITKTWADLFRRVVAALGNCLPR